ncbi:MAG: 50S ribosomal protein L21 [Christensenellaceae bacterium]|jgi:large subunit ribosomal protein L21|nr:50S ribosomal protein L21 [Christensenellaceae bacterium]
MTSIIKTGGKQYFAAPNAVLSVEKLDAEIGEEIALETVNGFGPGKITATVVEHGRGDKINGFKYKAKKNVRKKWGHRQSYTKIKIGEVK